MMFWRKYSISILDRNWKTLFPVVKMKHIPRANELIFIEDDNRYYRVLNVVTYVSTSKRTGAWVIVEELDQKPQDVES